MADEPRRDDDLELFERAMSGVDRIEPRVVTTRRPPRRRRPRRPPPAEFAVETFGEVLEGRDRREHPRLLHQLRTGKWPIEGRLDLHGHRLEAARLELSDFLRRALEERMRCVLVIHGRGLRSTDGPVLKTALPAWLAEPPHGSRVRAFVTAPTSEGGYGATLVLLRRRR